LVYLLIDIKEYLLAIITIILVLIPLTFIVIIYLAVFITAFIGGQEEWLKFLWLIGLLLKR